MQIRFSLAALSVMAMLGAAHAQTTFIPQWAKENVLLDRLEIKAQKDNDLNLSTVKPYMRKAYVQVADSFRNMLLLGQNPARLTRIDQYNLDRFQANNSEYSSFDTSSMPGWKSKKKFLNVFWPTKGNMIEVNTKDFYLSVNPLLNQQQSVENDFDERVFVNSKGVTARGLIARKIGFNFYLSDNQEQGPLQFREFVDSNDAVPGTGFFKNFKENKGYDYFDARGSVSWNVTKYINMQFGYDQQFIGNGYRSLFLSNAGAPSLFLKFNTRIWKINYTNLYMEYYPTGQKSGDKLLDKKYASMHHFSINATKWLTVGAFESIIFGRPNHYDFSYLIPVIFLRSIEQQNGSSDNANIGFDVKANVAKKFQFYGQLMLDEFKLDEVKSGKYWWANKQAFQLGGKYVDAFGIHNLDIQAEFNQIRPFTYSHNDSISAYTNYLQPLAHIQGANLREVVGIIRYQPTPRLYFYARVNYWKQGLDSAGYNFGANPNRVNTPVGSGGGRLRFDNYPMFSGTYSSGLNAYFCASYELKENLFVDLSVMARRFEKDLKEDQNIIVPTIGLRWNMFRREYDW